MMAKQMDRSVVVIDVESTCWEPPEYQPFTEISEIIEIGIAVVNIDSLVIEKNDSIIVRPQRSKLSKFCTKLTTLTQEYVDQGTTFQAAIEILRRDYNTENRTFVSWGDYDRKQFQTNCKDYGVRYPFGPRHMNLKNTFALLNRLPKEYDLDAALKYLEMPLEGTHHRGIDDARNIAKIFIAVNNMYRVGWDHLPEE